MGENGEEKLLAVARHIAKTLGRDDSMTDDILQIFSKFDGRFSRDKLSPSSSDPDPSRAYAPPLELTLRSLDRQISHYLSSDQPIWSDSADSSAFLGAVDELLATLKDWGPTAAADKAVFACLSRADELMQHAMFRLRDEFRTLMDTGSDSPELGQPYGLGSGDGGHPTLGLDSEDEEEHLEGVDAHIPVARPVTDFDIIIDALPSGTINDLHEIAKRMVTAGFAQECASVYSSYRREFLEESMSRLGLQKLSVEEAQKMLWQDLEDEIERWIKAMNVVVRVFFPSERRLCDRVFSGLSSAAADFSFMEVCRGSMVQLLNFADAISIGSRAPERLFKVLDVFETLRDLMPEFEALFSDQFCLLLRNEAITIWKRLGEVIRGIFMELENLIRRDPAKAAVPGGGLHPITRYVMNYLRAACRSRQALEQVFEDNASPNEYVKLETRAVSSSLSVQMAWIMDLLESNLEAKSKVYSEAAQCCIFMMNNAKYIVQKVRDSELGTLLGEDWIRKHTAKVRQYQQNYIRSSWNRVVVGLKQLDGSSSLHLQAPPPSSPMTMREKLKSFNAVFEETCRVQSSWVFADEQVREDLKISVIKLVVPAYQAFVSRLQNVPEMRKQLSAVKGVEEIEARIGDLFVSQKQKQ